MAILYAITSAVLGTLIFLQQFESFAVFSFQYGTLFALVPISFYNGERGVRRKELNRWFFYVFYPAHMLVLVVFRAILS